MLGALNHQHREVTIVGAGIAGLLLAEALDHAGWEVTLLEAAEMPGGMIVTRKVALGLAEAAAHSLQATPAVDALCARLGVELSPLNPDSRARWIWRRGRPRRIPISVFEAVRMFFRAYLVLASRGVDPKQVTLEAWGRRHLGQPALKFLLTPFVRGIYGARPSEITVAMAFPSLVVPHGHSLVSATVRNWRLRLFGRGTPKRPRARMVAPQNGMATLTDALTSRLRDRLGDRFKTGLAVGVLPHAKNLVLCVPPQEASRILSEEDAALSLALRQVRHAPLVSVTAFVERDQFPRVPRGVGVLLPEGTERKSLGILFNSSSFPNRVADEHKWLSLTLMMGGTSKPEWGARTDAEIQAGVREDLEELYDLKPGARIETVIHRYERAIPLYGPELSNVWEAARAGWCAKPGHLLFGNYTGQVSIRGMIETVSQLH